ncbi:MULTISPECIES: 5-formyltetrahydrofolate cyclo-ligase [unclassified Brevibacterium]|uniref:5-formyltetrahydrofolate cyclo-ligase n=1 Tax=unclassified Brevibacterium TaxID=2614124 RepID=UPI001F10CB20|nr:5-formyltetrahydrofolate cyclo-ligase [Brevibacterium sp. S22]
MEPETSKAQLRSRVRAARAERSLAEAAPASSASATSASSQVTSTEAASAPSSSEAASAPSSSVAASAPSSSVAASAWNVIQKAPIRSLLAYAALPGEPDLDPALDQFLAAGGTVYLPVVTTVGEPLMFGQVTGSMASLEPHGRWGIREPAQDSTLLTAAQLLSPTVGLDLIFVPALGFGIDGARLGNGGGFYDRTFGPHGAEPLGSELRVVGVCFAEEIGLTGLVAEDWDLRIPAAVTEDGTHFFAA